MKGSSEVSTCSIVEKTPQEIIDAEKFISFAGGDVEENIVEPQEIIDAENFIQKIIEETGFRDFERNFADEARMPLQGRANILEKTPKEITKAEQSIKGRFPGGDFGETSRGPGVAGLRDFKRIVVDDKSRYEGNIFEVPNYMKSRDDKAYEPTIVGIGLFHHNKGQYQFPILHSLKIQCVPYLIARHGRLDEATELLGKCREEMISLEPQVRRCYSEDGANRYVEIRFADMMLRDGCFILFLLLREARSSKLEVVVKDGEEGKSEETNTKEENYLLELHEWEEEIIQAPLLQGMLWTWKLVVYDLLKLENQIPFLVVRRLFDLLKTPADEGIDLVQLALKLFATVNPTKAKTFITMPSSQVHHLLHLYHSSLIPSKLITLADEKSTSGKVPDWIPCATELQEAGIKFRPMKKDAKSFLDVAFKDGVMEIPPLVVDDSTTSVFRNLIAFEQCYPATRTHVTVYAAFMDCIINTTKDVNLLKLNGILSNRLGTEQAAADLFNKLCDQIHLASDRNYLWEMFTEVTKYYESPWHKWRAELVRNYFSNPWAAISVVAAVVLLLLTIQQAVFAAVSYFHPLH